MKGVSQAGRRAVRRRVRRQKGGGALRALAGCLIATLLVLAAVRFGHCGFDDSCGSHLSSDFSGLVRSLAGGRRPPPVAPSYAAASGSAMTVPLHQGGSVALPAGRLAFESLTLQELRDRAVEAGASSDAILEAKNADNAKAAMYRLILKTQEDAVHKSDEAERAAAEVAAAAYVGDLPDSAANIGERAPAPVPAAAGGAPCRDSYDVAQCPLWAGLGHCGTNERWMATNCALSCRVCADTAPASPPPAAITIPPPPPPPPPPSPSPPLPAPPATPVDQLSWKLVRASEHPKVSAWEPPKGAPGDVKSCMDDRVDPDPVSSCGKACARLYHSHGCRFFYTLIESAPDAVVARQPWTKRGRCCLKTTAEVDGPWEHRSNSGNGQFYAMYAGDGSSEHEMKATRRERAKQAALAKLGGAVGVAKSKPPPRPPPPPGEQGSGKPVSSGDG